MALTKQELQDQVAKLLNENPEAARDAGFTLDSAEQARKAIKAGAGEKPHEIDLNELTPTNLADPVKRQAAWAAVNKALRGESD